MLYLGAVVQVFGLGLDLFGVFQHPFIQNQCLAPLLHHHVRLGDEEAPAREGGGGTQMVGVCVCVKDKKEEEKNIPNV